MLEGIGKHDPTAFTGVVGYWAMDEVSTEPISGVSIPDPTVWWRYTGDGSTVTDEGAGINGTVVNGPVPVSADGYEFDGVNQYVAATYSPAPSGTAISLAVVCKADSFSSNEGESPTRKIPLALGIGDSVSFTYRGVFFNFRRTSSSPDRAEVQFQTCNASTSIGVTSTADLCDVGVRMCLVGSADLSTDLSRLLYADENGVVRFYTAYNSFSSMAYDSTSPQLESGRHRQSDINDRYWDGTIKEAQVYDGVALDFRQMLQLAQELLGVAPRKPIALPGRRRRDVANAPLGGAWRTTASGDLEVHGGESAARKRIERRCLIAEGSFFHLADYGAGLESKRQARAGISALAAKVRVQVAREDEVLGVDASAYRVRGAGVARIAVRARLRGDRVFEGVV